MRWSQAFIPTLREAPADAEVASHIFLLRAGYVRQLSAGIYSYLFLAQRALLKITAIVRQEMDAIGQEFLLPALHPAELWQTSGRWQGMGDNMFRLKDRFQRDFCLGMTHEEVMADIARKELKSYKQLPQIWYQIQNKFRDEPRPKSGLLRVRQFTMKDSYSFDIDEAGLDVSYQKHHAAYCRIFDRCGLRYVVVEAHSGAMGGSQSHEFMVQSDAGEDLIAVCGQCGYAANLEKACAGVPSAIDPESSPAPEPFATPHQRTIAEVVAFTGEDAGRLIKSLLYMVEEGGKEVPVLFLLSGNHELNEAKMTSALGGHAARPAQSGEIEKYTGAPAGSVGPLGLVGVRLLADLALRGRRSLVAGANREGFHLRHVTPERDFQPEWAELRTVLTGDLCLQCSAPLTVMKTVEIGHIFKLGRKYTESMQVRVLDSNGREVVPIMGSYGIGIERILTAVIEQNHDDSGFWMPPAVAPFAVVVTPVNVKDQAIMAVANDVYATLKAAGIDVLLDDRNERPGVKFKDAELIGIPVRVTVGKRAAEGVIEVVTRSTREVNEVPVAALLDAVSAAGGTGPPARPGV
mgnify:CR=1 FL=1